MRETLHLVTAEDYPHDAVAMATYFRTPRPNHLPDGVDMERVVELARHAAEALDEPLEATALRPILTELEKEMADDRVWRRVRTNAPILHAPGEEPRRKKDVATLEATPFVKLSKLAKEELEHEAVLALTVLEPHASGYEVAFTG